MLFLRFIFKDFFEAATLLDFLSALTCSNISFVQSKANVLSMLGGISFEEAFFGHFSSVNNKNLFGIICFMDLGQGTSVYSKAGSSVRLCHECILHSSGLK